MDSRTLSRILLLIPAACASAGSTHRAALTSEAAFQLLTTWLALDYSDSQIAEQINPLHLAGAFSSELTSVLKKEGAGVLTLQALAGLEQRSAASAPPLQAIAALQPVPGPEDERALLEKVSQYASGYVRRLPDFMGAQRTRFFVSGRPGQRSGKSKQKSAAAFHLEQTINEDLGYYGGEEHHRTRLVNDVPDQRPIDKIRKFFSRGEFGTILNFTFDPASEAHFHWDHWEFLRGRQYAVFSYLVDRAHSQYEVCCTATGTITLHGVPQPQYKHWIASYRGLLYADPDTGAIARLTYRLVDIPSWVDLDGSGSLVDYAPVTLNERIYWLPVRAVHHTRIGDFRLQDEIEFSKYRKFDAESTITFTDSKSSQ